ncbi:hypothetical protein [Catenovulum sediminis]|uniref:Methyltransferase domain-containing protein n=1 Tax=Catenovulum sediminis TaxID=1740262 RepID=A0ABV1RGW0_9ALTE
MTNAEKMDTSKKHENLVAYEGVELLSNFSPSEFERYCDHKLSTCDKHIQFIKNYCLSSNWQGVVCEVGSGNSKLLYRLELEKLLTCGYGVEASYSRYQFAQKFKNYVASTKVKNINSDLFDLQPLQQCDMIIGVDVILQLISPMSDNAEQQLLSWCFTSLKEQGYLLLEMVDYSSIVAQLPLNDGMLQTWKKFPHSDPFEYILCKVFENENRDLRWEKTFLKRNSLDKEYSTNILRPYSKSQIINLLKETGFAQVSIFDKWCDDGEVDDNGEYIVLAQK